MKMQQTIITGQIYLITNKITRLEYVGQVRSHYKSKNSYKVAGYLIRWKAHVREAHSQYKWQCVKLNRAIRKYGADNFEVELLYTCNVEDLDYYEIYFIDKLDSYKYGYNLTTGGKCGQPNERIQKNISNTLKKYYDDQKLDMFEGRIIKDIKLSRISSCGIDIASILVRADNDNVKVDFGGKLCPFEESVNRAIKFALLLTDESNIVIQDKIKEMVTLKRARSDDRLLQNSQAQKRDNEGRLDHFRNKIVNKIRIIKSDKNVALMTVTFTDKTRKNFSYGGLYCDFNESIERAVNLALQVTTKDHISLQDSINYKF